MRKGKRRKVKKAKDDEGKGQGEGGKECPGPMRGKQNQESSGWTSVCPLYFPLATHLTHRVHK